MRQEVTVEDATDSAPTVVSGVTVFASADGNSSTTDNSEVHLEMFDTSSDVNQVTQALPSNKSSCVFEDDLVDSDSDTVDECAQPLLQAYDDQTRTRVTGIYACMLFAEILDKEINMEVVDFVKNLVKPVTQVFDEMFHPISAVKSDSSNLVKFDERFLALPRMLSACSSSDTIIAYLLATLPLSSYRFPADQVELDFPFDPGSSLLTTVIGSARCYSFMVVDDIKEIIEIFVCHIGTNDQFILNQFPYDPGANLFIVTPGGRLQVHPLLLLVMDSIQIFGSVFYIRRRTVEICHRHIRHHNISGNTHAPPVNLSDWEHAKATVKKEPTISIWDAGIHIEFMFVTSSTDKIEAPTQFATIRKSWSCLFSKLSDWEQLGGVELGVEAFDAMYLNICFRVTKRNEDRHLVQIFVEYERCLPVEEPYFDDVKVKISKFIISAKFMCKILEQRVGNQLSVARRQNNRMTLSSPAYFVYNSYWSLNLQPYSYSSARCSSTLPLLLPIFKTSFFGHPKEEVECYLAQDVAFHEQVTVSSLYSPWAIRFFYGICFGVLALLAAWGNFQNSSSTDATNHAGRRQQKKQLVNTQVNHFVPCKILIYGMQGFHLLFPGAFELLCTSCVQKMFPRLLILLQFPGSIDERICYGVYDKAVREHSQVESNILPSLVGILQCVHQESDKIRQTATTLCEATRDNVVTVAGYKTLFMELLCRTLLRRFFGHQSSVARSVKDPRHVRKFFVYVQLWAFDNDVVGAKLYNSNLEDKVLIGVGGIVMNGPRPVFAKQPNTIKSGYVWDPG